MCVRWFQIGENQAGLVDISTHSCSHTRTQTPIVAESKSTSRPAEQQPLYYTEIIVAITWSTVMLLQKDSLTFRQQVTESTF